MNIGYHIFLNEIERKIINIHVVDLDTKINFPFSTRF